MKLGIITPAFALLLGCSSADQALFRTAYVFSFHGPEVELNDATNAAAQWEACGVVDAFVTAHANPSGPIPWDEIGVTRVDSIPDYPNAAGIMRQYPSRIEYIDGNWNASRQAIIAHEMGHALGLPHYGDGIMNAHVISESVSPIDCATLAIKHPIQWEGE